MRSGLTFAAVVFLLVECARGQSGLEVYSADPFVLLKVKESLQDRKSPFLPAFERLLRDAEKALDVTPPSVVSKDRVPQGGSKHDYMSLSRYWWPDPSKPNGLPYIRKDGETNPETADYRDHDKYVVMASSVSTLGLAYFFSGREEFAKHAARLVRTWYLDSATAMSPHLEYSQSIPGRSTGRGTGILDGRHIALVLDAVGMIRGSQSWTDKDQSGILYWCNAYVRWLTESDKGKDEADATNNHGTWYDAHVTSVALFVGRKDMALQVVQAASEKRIFAQISPDGGQPEETARTRPWNYCVFNLEAFARLATQAQRLNVDLWKAKGADGRSLRQAVDYLLPFALEKKEWPFKDIDGLRPEMIVPVLLWATASSGEPVYLQAARSIGGSRLREIRPVLLTGVVIP
ncbi:MAG: hypothetical protein A2X67_11285 [Ignavibacteria bacterium GWA2_55_11]|nr:MAG: hypothetical protein A2X67_11285 [Ignavibacteria bacterium GWA2_55_11]OGU45406.1 MAG: hypothetical protein A2X68_07760 [Ignavibacteria bacterium GWC2_56_12]HAV22026.1 hypothetical protein [Bacteroidota bacterium]